ncbi:MAG: pyridoxal phosphate-dependent aminotransferase, partial [Thermoanaerobaculales bacterium]
MPSLSPKSAQLQASPIRKLAPHARAAEARGVGVIYLNIGQPDMPTPPEMLARLHDLPLTRLAYAPSEGLPEAREAWSAFFKSWGIGFAADEILVTAGASEALTFILSIVAGGGDEVLVFEPCYTNYLSFAAQADVRMAPITLEVEDAYHFGSIDRLRAAISPQTKAILLCNPSNPTGTVYTRDELEAVARVAVESDLFVICDEVYREFVFDGGTVRTFTEFSDLAQRIIVVDSVSKRFNACGVRIGCLATHNREIIDVALRFCQARLSVPTAEQLMVVPMLEDGRAYSERLCSEYQNRRDAVYEGLAAIGGVSPHRSEGAFYTMTRLPIESCEDFAVWLLRDFVHNGETVCLAPGEGFYVTEGLGVDEVRLAFMYDAETLARAMRVLGAAVAAY